MTSKNLVCIGAFAGAHGVRGDVHIRFFTEAPWDIKRFPELLDEAGKASYHLVRIRGVKKTTLIASFKEITSREQAHFLKGKKLYVPRESLPELEEESYYQTDLIGCEVYTLQDEFFGRVKSLYNFGAGDVLEIYREPEKDSVFVDFSKRAIPRVDLKGRRLTMDVGYTLPLLKDKP